MASYRTGYNRYMVMNERSYKIAYRSSVVSGLQDVDDLVTALVNIFEATSEDYKNYGFTKVKKSFDTNDTFIANKHETALPLLIGLNSETTEIIEQWPEPNDRKSMHDIYGLEKRGKSLPSTSLNELVTKLSNVKRIVDFMKEEYPVVIRRTFFYQNNKLFIDQLKPMSFLPYSDADITLELLFKAKFKVWNHLKLEKQLIKKRPSPKNTTGLISFSKPLKNAIEHINFRISKDYSDYKDTKIIFQRAGMVGVDTTLFHASDRLNRKKQR